MSVSLDVTIQKILISALLLTTISDCIKGFSLDILSPIINRLLPGDIKRPVTIFNIRLYITRFLIRITNLLIAIAVVRYLRNKTY